MGNAGTQLWSERFDRALSAFFTIQEELGPKILQIVPAKVSEAEMRRVAQPHTRSLEAYEYFQRGQSALRVRQKADNEIGAKCSGAPSRSMQHLLAHTLASHVHMPWPIVINGLETPRLR